MNKTWATEILREDHQRIKDLFDDLSDPQEAERLAEIRDLTVTEIRVHRALVDEILVPAIRIASGDPQELSEVEEEMERWEPLLSAVEKPGLKSPALSKAWKDLTAEINRHMDHGDKGLMKVGDAVELDYVALGLKMIELRRQIMAERPGDTGGVSGA